jgi:hypothetical protein
VTEDPASRPPAAAGDALDQIFVSYQPAQDRLLMRLGTVGRAEVRLWLTRRLLKELWGALTAIIESDEAVLSRTDAAGRQALLAFRHEQALAQSQFSLESAEAASRPMGDAPLLLTRLALVEGSAQPALRLADAEGRGVEFAVNVQLAHSLARLIADAVEKADWGLALKLGQTERRPRAGAAVN